KRTVEKASQYLQNHASDVDQQTRLRLEAAEQRLREANAVVDLEQIVLLAQAVETEADAAYTQAQSEVQANMPVEVEAARGGSDTAWSPDPDPGGGTDTSFNVSDSGGGGSDTSW